MNIKCLLNERLTVFTTLGRPIARNVAKTFTVCLILMISLGFLGSAMAHSSVARERTSIHRLQQPTASFSHPTPLSKKSSNHEDLALSFFWEAWDLEQEAKELLGLAPVYTSFSLLEDNPPLLLKTSLPLSEERNSFSERHHAPIFLFLQIFRI